MCKWPQNRRLRSHAFLKEMKMSKFFKGLCAVSAVALVVFVAGATLVAAPKAAKDVSCPVSGKPCNESHAVDFAGGKVYFCCPNCPKAFQADSAKFAAKSHQQMVATGQLKQIGCPISGKAVNPSTVIEIGGASVGFCCNNCKGMAEKATGDEQVKLVFGDISKSFKAAGK